MDKWLSSIFKLTYIWTSINICVNVYKVFSSKRAYFLNIGKKKKEKKNYAFHFAQIAIFSWKDQGHF